jgi:capsule polysaccharide export protein KpsE/RkpR
VESSGQGVAPAPAVQDRELEAEPPRWAIARLLWLHRALLWRTIWKSAIVSTIIVFLIPKHYESTAQLMPPDLSSSDLDLLEGLQDVKTGGSGTGMLGAGAGVVGKLLGQNDEGQVLIGVMQSQSLEDRIIDRFGLMKHYHDRYIEDARKDLEDHVEAQEDRKSGIISITVTEKDPQLASAIAHAYVDELGALMAQVSTSAARRERIFIEDRLKVVKSQLDDAARDFSNFASRNTAIDIPEQGKAMMEAAALLQGQIIAAQSELSGLKQIYTENNARVKQTEAQVGELQRQLNKFGGKDVGPGHATEDPASMYPSIRELPLLGVKYADLYLNLKIDETVYEMLRERYELAKVEEAKEIPSVQVLDPGVPAQKKSFPPRFLFILLGIFLAAGTVACWIIANAYWQGSDPQDERKLLLQEIYETTKQHRAYATITRGLSRVSNLIPRRRKAEQ